MTEQKIYRLVDLMRRLDRDKSTLIRWEAEGRIPKAKRDVRGWRYYTPEDFGSIVQFVEREINFHEKLPAEEGSLRELVAPEREEGRTRTEPVTLVVAPARDRTREVLRGTSERMHTTSPELRAYPRMIFPRTASERARSLLYTATAMFVMLFIGHFAIYIITAPPTERNTFVALGEFSVLFSQNFTARFTDTAKELARLSLDGEVARMALSRGRGGNVGMDRTHILIPGGFDTGDGMQTLSSFLGIYKIFGYFAASAPDVITSLAVKNEKGKTVSAHASIFKRNDQDSTLNKPIATGSLAMNEREFLGHAHQQIERKNVLNWLHEKSTLFQPFISEGGEPRVSGGVIWREFTHHFRPYTKARRIIFANAEELELLFRSAYYEAQELRSGFHSFVIRAGAYYLDRGAAQQTTAEYALLHWNYEFIEGSMLSRSGIASHPAQYGQKNTQATLLVLWDELRSPLRREPVHTVH